MDIESRTIISQGARATYQELADGRGGVILHLDTAAYHGLNATGALIWELLGDGISFGELIRELEQKFEGTPDGLAEDVREFVERLVERDLVLCRPTDGRASSRDVTA
jgi:hypothetical protein